MAYITASPEGPGSIKNISTMGSDARPSQVLLLSLPRTACHLLERMLSAQSTVKYLPFPGHPIHYARPAQVESLTDDSVANDIPSDKRQAFESQVLAGVQQWKKALDEAQSEFKTLFIHEHPHFALKVDRALSYAQGGWQTPQNHTSSTNWSMIPDDLLLFPGTSVIMTFRHPAIVISEGYRAMSSMEHSASKPNLLVSLSFLWQRELYEWFVANGIRPVVVEAEDYISSKKLVKKICAEAGLDPNHAIFEWEAMPHEEQERLPQITRDLMRTLLNSTGLITGKAKKDVDVDEEEKKWIHDFGEEEAKFNKEMVDANMEHYEVLKNAKLRL